MMPFINTETFKGEELELVKMIVVTQGKNKGHLRTNKPSLPKKIRLPHPEPTPLWHFSYGYEDEAGNKAGMAAYIWRHVAFYISPLSQHRCMPTLDWCDLPLLSRSDREALEEKLQDLVKRIVDTVPLQEQYGTLSWAMAFGTLELKND